MCDKPDNVGPACRGVRRLVHAAIAPVTGLLLLAGCFGMCGYTPENAAWVGEGLFAWVEENGAAGARRSDGGDGDDGFPFAAEVGGMRPSVLRSLHWEAHSAGASLTLAPDGVTLGTRQSTTELEVRGLFRRFSANVSAADAGALQDAEDAFVASAVGQGGFLGEDVDGTYREVPMVSYRGALPGPYRFEEFYAATGATPTELPPDPYAEVSRVSAQGQGFGWVFTVPSWTIPLEDGSITVNSLDRVTVSTGAFRENDGDADVQRKVMAAFTKAGLPEPDLEGMQHGGPVC